MRGIWDDMGIAVVLQRGTARSLWLIAGLGLAKYAMGE